MGFGVWGLGFGVWGLGFGVWGLGFGVWGLGFGVWGLGFREQWGDVLLSYVRFWEPQRVQNKLPHITAHRTLGGWASSLEPEIQGFRVGV